MESFKQIEPHPETGEIPRSNILTKIGVCAVESNCFTVQEIVEEIAATRITERGARTDDKRSEAAMEDRKKEGYF